MDSLTTTADQLSSLDLVAAAMALSALLILIFSWVKRGEVSTWEKKIAKLEKRLTDSPPEIEIELNEKQAKATEEKIASGKEVLDKLKQDVQALSSNVQMIENGLYPPTFGYLDSESLKESISAEREKQLEIIKGDKAVSKYGTFTLFGSKKDGAALVTDYKKVFLRTFNAEFEDIRKKLRMSNVESSEDKLYRISEQLESLGEVLNVEIDRKYLSAKSRELDVWSTEIEERHKVKEERKEQQRLLREQKKEFKKDDEELETEIEISTAMLNKAKKRALELVGMTDQDVTDELKSLEKEIAEHETRIEESMSEAQKTKAGYIYVISNVGSFGEGILKIGMTRRLEPMDRVVELGDASVPYRFDVHTIAFVENAPDIERKLHQHFHECRINKENDRKEFFAVAIKDVREALESLGVESEWYFDVEAREHSESELIRAAKKQTQSRPAETVYPEAI
ncbi:MAG: DUF4041 domain-containing protein [Pseudomonadales bacterium]